MISPKRIPIATFGVAAVATLVWMAGCEGQPSEPVVTSVRLAPGGGGPPPKVNAADPPNAEQDTTLDVRVLGSNFDDGSNVEYTIDGVPQPKVRTNSVDFVSESELVSNITIDFDALVDFYDVEVMTTRGKKGIGADKFEVVMKGGNKDGTVDMPDTTQSNEANGMSTPGRQSVVVESNTKSRINLYSWVKSVIALRNTKAAAESAQYVNGDLLDSTGALVCATTNVDSATVGDLVDKLADNDTVPDYRKNLGLRINLNKLGAESDRHHLGTIWDPDQDIPGDYVIQITKRGWLDPGFGSPWVSQLSDEEVIENGVTWRKRVFRFEKEGQVVLFNRRGRSPEWPEIVCENLDAVEITVFTAP